MYPLLIIACSKRYFVVALVRGSPSSLPFLCVVQEDFFRAAAMASSSRLWVRR